MGKPMTKEIARAPHKATRAVVKSAGAPEARELYATWTAYNKAYFKRKLSPPMVLITDTGRALGDYVSQDVHGLQSVIRIAPKSVERGERFRLDVLLHEMVHAYMHEVEHTDERSYRGHGPKFAAVCNEIGAKLGLAEVGVKGRDGKPDCMYWPMCVRPADYYPEAFTPPTRADKTKPRDEESEDAGSESGDEAQEAPTLSALAKAGLWDAVAILRDNIDDFERAQDRKQLAAVVRYLERLAQAHGCERPVEVQEAAE